MKIFLAAIGIFLASLVGGVSATVGPEVAVMQIKVGKEKEFQQVVLGLYDDAAPATVENFKELCRRKFVSSPARLCRLGTQIAVTASRIVLALADPGIPFPPRSGEIMYAEPSPCRVCRMPSIRPRLQTEASFTCA